YAPYSPAKAAMRSLADTLNQELEVYNGARHGKGPAPDADIKMHIVFPMGILSPGYENEELTKPALTKKLEESDKPQTPDEVALIAIKALEKGEYLITTTFIGLMMKASAIASSVRDYWFKDTVLSVLANVVFLGVIRGLHRTAREWGRKMGIVEATNSFMAVVLLSENGLGAVKRNLLPVIPGHAVQTSVLLLFTSDNLVQSLSDQTPVRPIASVELVLLSTATMLKFLLVLPLLVLSSGGLAPESTALRLQQPIFHHNDTESLRPIYPCWGDMSCSFLDIESMSMPDRLSFLKYIIVHKLTLLDAADQAGAEEGMMNFMIGKKLSHTKTYLSCLNAAVLESVQRGAAIALNISRDTGGNPASPKWAKFFIQYQRGQLDDRNYHDLAWAKAEQSAIDYGILLAETLPGIEQPTGRILRFVRASTLYRTIMMYRRTILWLLRISFAFTNPSVAFSAEELLDWLTDITQPESIEFLGEVSWAVSALKFAEDGEDDPLGDAEVALKLLTGIWDGFKARDHTNFTRIRLS
ncbi:hypothetical protein KEM56_000545, partial [Ascosphaera pollenicola]